MVELTEEGSGKEGGEPKSQGPILLCPIASSSHCHSIVNTSTDMMMSYQGNSYLAVLGILPSISLMSEAARHAVVTAYMYRGYQHSLQTNYPTLLQFGCVTGIDTVDLQGLGGLSMVWACLPVRECLRTAQCISQRLWAATCIAI